MVNFTIDEFWSSRLAGIAREETAKAVLGWSFQASEWDEFLFTEAPLTHSTKEFGDEVDPKTCSILLVSAPGAVGKSTLAKQIALKTGSIYVDLAAAEPVGGNFLTGGLARSGKYASWLNGSTSAMIDGLDEAMLKSRREGFEAFLRDVADLAVSREIPTVLFGRTGSVMEAWLHLDDLAPGEVAVLEIGYYDHETAVEFAVASLKSLRQRSGRRNEQHPSVDRDAVKELLGKVRDKQTELDSNRFVGYAPVLQAVAAHVNLYDNPSQLISELEVRGASPLNLQGIVTSILEREQGKLKGLKINQELKEKLYLPDEQLDRLVAEIYGAPPPPLPSSMSPEDRVTYSDALEDWVAQHPFYDKGSQNPPSVVFHAAICAHALLSSSTAREKVAMEELSRGDAANPFLYHFYINASERLGLPSLAPEHVGILYSSIRSSLAQGEFANLFIEDLNDPENAHEWADVEIQVSRFGGEDSFLFNTDIAGPVCFGPHVRDAVVLLPRGKVEIGQGGEVVLVAPVDVQCQVLTLLADRVIVENSPESSEVDTYGVYLQARQYSGSQMSSVPITRSSAKLFVSWPGAEGYPWHDFKVEISTPTDDDPNLYEALRRFRMFVVTCRGLGRNQGIAQSRRKIDSGRMTKGPGQQVLDLMLSEMILYRSHSLYYLSTDRLAQLTQMNYADCMAFQFKPEAIDFVKRALSEP